MAGSSKKQIALGITLALVTAYSLVVVPSVVAAPGEREARSESITIASEDDFNPANGVRGGSGTKSDPFVISNWDVSSVHIRDTDEHFVIRDNTIDNLTLNWNGDRVTIVKNNIGDLRVNENVKRTGGPTTGLIAHNTFGIVGQLRHFDGVFAHNTVGSAQDANMAFPFFDNRAVNFDGFHGARFFNNVLYGYLEVRLHGHHHGSGYEAGSHYHGPPPAEDEHAAHAGHAEMEMVDHTRRYHQVHVYNNTIYSDGFQALVYTDSNHAGNDRTNASETNKELNKAHEHFTKVHITNNKLVGSGLVIDIFNAKDERHTNTNRGLVHIANNSITLARSTSNLPLFDTRTGILVSQVTDLGLRIVGNSIAYDSSTDPFAAAGDNYRDTGIALQNVDIADVSLGNNSVSDVYYGISASWMTETVSWAIWDLETKGVAEPVWYDSSVKNHPEETP